MSILIVDKRMPETMKIVFKNMSYELIELEPSSSVYPEISAHPDIFVCKVGNKLIVEESKFEYLKAKLTEENLMEENLNEANLTEEKVLEENLIEEKLTKENLTKGNLIEEKIEILQGSRKVTSKYPEDIKYNVCIVGKKAIHNFNYTDNKILEELKYNNYELINVKQGYSNCSIAVIDENSIIVSDKGIYEILKQTDLDILFLDYEPDIKLFDENKNYSMKKGFIGGAISRVGNNIVILGELKKIDKDEKIRNFIKAKNLNLIEFVGQNVIDLRWNC
jgi:hypothetical protein